VGPTHDSAPTGAYVFRVILSKNQGTPWLQGSALFYVYHLDEFRRLPFPSWFLHPGLLKLGSWSALILEFSLGVLIWAKEFRYHLLALGVLFRKRQMNPRLTALLVSR